MSCDTRFKEEASALGYSFEGELKIHVPIVGRSVERVIVSGLRDYVHDEVVSIPAQPSPPSG